MTLKPMRLADQVADALLDQIRSEQLLPGDRLPTEADLSTQFGVSRTAVREATRFLVARGVVEVRAGSGAVVVAVAPESAADSLALFLAGRPPSDYVAMHEVREALEIRSARYAAERATPQAIEQLAAAHGRMAAVDDSDFDTLGRADIAFHNALAAASDNEILRTLLEAMGPGLMQPRRVNLVEAGARREALASHEAVLAAVCAHDPDAAEIAMRDHMTNVLATYQRLRPA